MKNQRIGKIIIPANAKPWPHEISTARILSKNGYQVEFIPETSIKTPDVYLNGTPYEMKSPISNKIDAVQRNLTRALGKCPNIIFDSSRMKVKDGQILNELIKRRKAGKGLKNIIFINKRQKIIDINILI